MKRHPLMAIMGDICAWLAANDIPYMRVPVDAVPTIKDGQITVRVHLLRNGDRYIDDKGNVASGSISVPLLVEPPASLERWLAGKVPAP